MEDQGQSSNPTSSSPSSSSSSAPSTSSREASGAASSSTVPVREEDDEHERIDEHQFQIPEVEQQQHIGITYRGNFALFDDGAAAIRDDTWSCIIVVLTFWFFVSMTLILGVYGSVSMRLGPNTSIIVQPNPIFVQSLKVEELDDTKPGPLLYGFLKAPPLDVTATWSKTQNASVPADSSKEWVYYLNKGSQINVTYNVSSAGSSVFFVIAQGEEGLAQWREDPTYPNTTLSWNVIHGVGMIQQNIYQSSSYYIAVGNLNTEAVEVQLNLGVKAYLYNTTSAYYKCTFSHGECSISVLFPEGNAAVIATPGLGQGTPSDDWYVRLSYGPRWITYVVGIGGMTVLMLLAFNFLNKFRWSREEATGATYGQMEAQRAPLLSYKDDDLSSWGSSYDSNSHDEEDIEELLAAGAPEGKLSRDGENGNNTRRLCGICFDAPRDCFFLPCGHCVACFECGQRIAEAAGTCPICRRNMKKVRKIFTV